MNDVQISDDQMIHKAIGPVWVVCLYDHTGFQYEYHLNQKQARRYDADPVAFQTAHLGMTKDQFLEWEGSRGVARCGARTASGRPCQHTLKGPSLSPREWLARHRKECCGLHAPASC